MQLLNIIALVILFFLLGKSADLIVFNLRKIGQKLGIKLFFLGLVLGAFTSLPEFAVGINTALNNVVTISFGNLIGGIFVLFGLVLGVSILLNRKIETGNLKLLFLPILVYLWLPLLLAFNGRLDFFEGLVLVVLYGVIIYFIYLKSKDIRGVSIELVEKKQILKSFLFIFLGIVSLIVVSNFVVRLTLALLKGLKVSYFVVGLLVYALGTNLPEILVTLRSWKNKIYDLSLSNLVGSAMGNVLILGIITFLRPIDISINQSFRIVVLGALVLSIALIVMGRSGRQFTRFEGIVLLLIYVIFVILQIIYQF